MSAPEKPMILYCTFIASGHVQPNLQIAIHLVKLGYDVTFLASDDSRAAIERSGCHYASHVGLAAHVGNSTPTMVEAFPEFLTMNPTDPATLPRIFEISSSLIIPQQLESARHAAAAMRARNPTAEIVLVCDAWWNGILPLRLGAPLLPPYDDFAAHKPLKSLGICITPSLFTSVDTGPSIARLGFDPSPSGREERRAAAKAAAALRSPENGRLFSENLYSALRACGIISRSALPELLARAHPGGEIEPFVFEAPYVAHDATLQMCIPELEWPVSDWPKSVKFGGTLPAREVPSHVVMPGWMEEVRLNGKPEDGVQGRKKVVVVAQGTVDLDHRNLVVPTIEALGGNEGVLVVAILCSKGMSLAAWYREADDGDADEKLPMLPANVRVVDYLPFDAVLPFADVFVSRSGYGGLQHGIANSVPMIQGGDGLDKPEIANRIQHAGMGLRLVEPGPARPEIVKKLVAQVLGDGKFRARAQELKATAEKFDALGVVERELRALWDDRQVAE